MNMDISPKNIEDAIRAIYCTYLSVVFEDGDSHSIDSDVYRVVMRGFPRNVIPLLVLYCTTEERTPTRRKEMIYRKMVRKVKKYANIHISLKFSV